MGNEVHISFNLSWDNSWRDDFNWDVVWLFVKYSTIESTDAWKHVKLTTTPLMPSGFISDLGKISDTECGGVFILRDKVSSGHVNSVPVTLKALNSNMGNITATQIADEEILVQISAIEMVYIPYGSYYLGDGSTPDRLGVTDGSSYLVDDEVVINSSSSPQLFRFLDGSRSGSALTVSANYPKGYKGFYCMKYEVSQEQYVSFLNSLNRTQQKSRIGNALDNLKEGEYVFGDVSTPTSRNGICVLSNEKNLPAIFAHNLKQDDHYNNSDDGQTLACNFLTPADILAYCDWACLRPMSEMEFEKACRRPYPQEAVGGEYAWNNTTLKSLTGEVDLQNGYSYMELPKDLTMNVNSGNGISGPVRCGSFGWSSTTQTQAGATFWGLMEMSGNLAEICYNISAANNFNTSNLYNSHGNGEINSSTGNTDIVNTIWGNNAEFFSLKGGSYASGEERLRVSDRSVLNAELAERNPEVGFRAVRTFGGSVVVNPGTIAVNGTPCASGISIKSNSSASITWNGVNQTGFEITYSWYVSKSASGPWTLIADATATSLSNYEITESLGTAATVTYYFKRKAESEVGHNEIILNVVIPNTVINFNANNVYYGDCHPIPITASSYGNNPSFAWKTPSGKSYSGAIYTPVKLEFSGNGELLLNCTLTVSGCKESKDIIALPVVAKASDKFASNECGEFMLLDERTTSYETGAKRTYCLVKIGTQCWMAENINVGSRVAGSNYNTHTTTGIQKICYNNNEANCDIYGGLYNWNEAVNGEKTGTPNQKYVPGSTMVQGICPDGWHIPWDTEWKYLEMALGMSSIEADKADSYRGIDQGIQMKSIDYWTYNTGTMGTNSSGFNGLPAGYRSSTGEGFLSFGTNSRWWASTIYSSTRGWHRFCAHSRAGVYREHVGAAHGFSVRCLKN